MNASVLKTPCLKDLDFSTLASNLSGMERETLRVDGHGRVAHSSHPAAIGHKLTHPSITVDFSEGLVEMVTAPHEQRTAMLAEQLELHQFVARHLAPGESFWALSMPPSAREQDIAIADFGSSLSGHMKEVYRRGLGARYGKIMQIISGVHYNFSFDRQFIKHMRELMGPDLDAAETRNRLYFRLVRGFDQLAWVLPYLFGASPIAAKTSVIRSTDWLSPLDDEHVYGEHATSLRMSDIGYQSPAQADLNVSHRNLNAYVRELVLATRTPWPEYETLGNRKGDDWVQLNGNILQIENEYYSSIRPKQIVARGERPACALKSRGVRYIEVRLLDVDPFEPLGLSAETAHFMEAYLLVCLARGEYGTEATNAEKNNLKLAIRFGRKPDLKLMRGTDCVPLRDWMDELLDDCAGVAEKLDAVSGGDTYARAVQAQRRKLQDPTLLPSQRVMDAASTNYGDWARQLSAGYTQGLAEAKLSAERSSALVAQVHKSYADAQALEENVGGEFADYVQEYFDSLCGENL